MAGQSSLRLESYLFTVEALEKAREHLAPDGALVVYNYYRPFVAERLAAQLAAVFDRPPCFELGQETRDRRMSVMAVGAHPDAVRCDRTWTATSEPGLVPATDDHPFPYLPSRTIPSFYLVALALIVGASAVLVRSVSGPLRRLTSYADLFFMGAAFLLLETKSVVQFALLFGTTWFVNALVFGGILLSVLGAVEVAQRARMPRSRVLYAALLGALAVAWVIPPHFLLRFSQAPRFVLAVTVAFAPIFLANLVFANRFRDVELPTVAFGANLLGAMIGGVLEYGALVVGYRNLLVAVAVLYSLAFVSFRLQMASGPASPVRIR